MSKIKQIIFDVDNTLVYGEEAKTYYSQYPKVLEKTLANCLAISLEEAKIIADKTRHENTGRGELTFINMNLGIEKWYDAISTINPSEYLKPNSSVNKILQSIVKNGINIGAITDGPIGHLDKICQAANLDKSIFDFCIGWQRGKDKPKGGSSKIYREMITKLKLKPNEILMIGDSLADDIIPAAECGLEVLHISTTQKSDYATITTIENLLSYLKKYD